MSSKNQRPYDFVTREFLIQNYRTERKTIAQISRETGASQFFIRRRMKEEKLRIRHSRRRFKEPANVRHNKAKARRIRKNPAFAMYEADSRTMRRIIGDIAKGIVREYPRTKFCFKLAYSVKDLKEYLESQFHSGMTWQNHGQYGWHLDHIVPRSKLPYTTRDEANFVLCWDLYNLRPLWSMQNIKEGNRRGNILPDNSKQGYDSATQE